MKHLKVKFVKNVFLCLKVPMATHMGTESNGFDVRFPSNLFNVTLPPPPRRIRKLKHVSSCLMLMAGSKFKKDAKKSPPNILDLYPPFFTNRYLLSTRRRFIRWMKWHKSAKLPPAAFPWNPVRQFVTPPRHLFVTCHSSTDGENHVWMIIIIIISVTSVTEDHLYWITVTLLQTAKTMSGWSS